MATRRSSRVPTPTARFSPQESASRPRVSASRPRVSAWSVEEENASSSSSNVNRAPT